MRLLQYRNVMGGENGGRFNKAGATAGKLSGRGGAGRHPDVRGRLGVAFDIGASVFRLALDEASARSLRADLNDYLTRVHSGRSGEMPQAPGSTPLDGEKV